MWANSLQKSKPKPEGTIRFIFMANLTDFCGYSPTRGAPKVWGGLAAKHYKANGLHGGPVGFHGHLDLDP
jgi:hypothetical protein